MNEPVASRPHIPGYGIPESIGDQVAWAEVSNSLENAKSYWIATSDLSAMPHCRPVDGVWLDGALYFAGGATKWSRNLHENAQAEVHLESTERVVILEGFVERIAAAAPDMIRVNEAAMRKYGNNYTGDRWAFRPRLGFAWTDFPRDATRWDFSR